jgi:hypothetical protein
MDAYDRCTNLGGKKSCQYCWPSMVEAEKFSDHPRTMHDVGDTRKRTHGQNEPRLNI